MGILSLILLSIKEPNQSDFNVFQKHKKTPISILSLGSCMKVFQMMIYVNIDGFKIKKTPWTLAYLEILTLGLKWVYWLWANNVILMCRLLWAIDLCIVLYWIMRNWWSILLYWMLALNGQLWPKVYDDAGVMNRLLILVFYIHICCRC